MLSTQVWELQRLGLLEGFDSDVSMHDRYKEFARFSVEQDQSKEWQWFMSREELGPGNSPGLKRLCLYRDDILSEQDQSRVGRAPRKLQEWCSLLFLELWSWHRPRPKPRRVTQPPRLGGFQMPPPVKNPLQLR